jgi:hypothetical protein
MPRQIPLPLMLLLSALVAACAQTPEPPPPAAATPAPVAVAPLFPATARVSGEEAARLLALDPIALRFLALKRLMQAGLVSEDEIRDRVATNKGALLPLSWPQPPASGLDRPIPPYDQLVATLSHLNDESAIGNSTQSRAAARAFVLDSLLPAHPANRDTLTPPDLPAARVLLDRVDRLSDTGLISIPEWANEKRAIGALIDSGKLREPAPPPPPPPAAEPERPKPKHPGQAKPYHGYEAVVLPNPPGVDPPALKSGAKGPAGLFLLSMASDKYKDKAWTTLKSQYPELAPLTPKVVKIVLKDLGTTYRLIAGPLRPDEAERLCQGLTHKGQTCTPTPFPP